VSGPEPRTFEADPPVAGRLEGQAAIITGGASNIGRAVAERLAGEGARLVLVDIVDDPVHEVAAALVAAGHDAIPLVGDIADQATVAAAVQLAVDTYGRLDILHNNAAATGPDVLRRDRALADLEIDTWDRAMAVNVRAAMLFCRYAAGPMAEGGGGAIVNTSSAAAFAGDTCRIAYSASKAALNSLTRSVATQLGPQGIRCNAVAPGLIASPHYAQKSAVDPHARLDAQLVPRFGRAQDIAGVVAFLCSGDAAFITGQVIPVDGGLFAHMPVLDSPT
jgi:NAD(P)-dependent dehydrogenase (short-subunit alcohol dehydrogenase family)